MPTEYITNRYMAKQGIPPQQVTWNDEQLTFDEISKFFTIPAVEAASILGVCTSTLKRICNENGIPRWPYRKIMAGKSIEEIKQEALTEPAAAQHLGVVKSSGQSMLQNPASSGRFDTKGMQNLTQVNMVRSNAVHLRQQSAAARYTSNSSVGGSHGLQKPKPLPPTFLDEFKQGFPSDGLSVCNNRWWGSQESKFQVEPCTPVMYSVNTSEAIQARCLDMRESTKDIMTCESLQKQSTEGPVTEAEGSKEKKLIEQDPMAAASQLVKLRRKAAITGRRALQCGVTRGYNYSTLTESEASTLKFVFGNNLSSQWMDSFSPS